MKYTIGVDLGGTNIVVGLVDEAHRIVARASCPTRAPRAGAEICDDIAALSQRLLAETGLTDADIAWYGLGSPGIVDGRIIEYANNLVFENEPLADLLEARVHRPVFLANDANAAAYGEFIAGVGQGYHSMAAVILGTGVGGGIILEDKIWQGFNGAAAELGHIVVEAGGQRCSCGKQGCLEAYAAMSTLVAYTRERMRQTPSSRLHALCGGNEGKLDGKMIFDARAEGDELAAEVLERWLRYLALGVSNIINLLQPEIVCIGGGPSSQGAVILPPLREQVWQQIYVHNPARRPRIEMATLGNDAGLIGAACLGMS